MHKINYIESFKEFSDAIKLINKEKPLSENSPRDRWNFFRNTEVHHKVICLLRCNQHSLCAFCEREIVDHEVDHFIPSSLSDSDHDYTFDLKNLLLCCGNKNIKNPLNCNPKKGNIDPRGKCLNPYEIPNDVILFSIELTENGIELMPDEVSCYQEGIPFELVKSTIDVLGLNSYFLTNLRKQLWIKITELIAQIIEKNGFIEKIEFLKLKNTFCNDENLPFITTAKLIFKNLSLQLEIN
jgi:uncharacterized protein (TIGR02646 family)